MNKLSMDDLSVLGDLSLSQTPIRYAVAVVVALVAAAVAAGVLRQEHNNGRHGRATSKGSGRPERLPASSAPFKGMDYRAIDIDWSSAYYAGPQWRQTRIPTGYARIASVWPWYQGRTAYPFNPPGVGVASKRIGAALSDKPHGTYIKFSVTTDDQGRTDYIALKEIHGANSNHSHPHDGISVFIKT